MPSTRQTDAGARRGASRSPRGARPEVEPLGLGPSPAAAGRRTGGGGARALVHGVLLVVGLAGAAATAWSMLEAGESRRVPERLGLERVASHWQEVLGLLALPALVFSVVLAVWSAFELYRLWRASLGMPGAPGARRAGRGPRGARPGDARRALSRDEPPLRLRGPR